MRLAFADRTTYGSTAEWQESIVNKVCTVAGEYYEWQESIVNKVCKVLVFCVCVWLAVWV